MGHVGFIYKYTSPSGKIYIGQTTRNLKTRAGRKGSHYQFYDTPFCRAIRKYGWEKFIVEILEELYCANKKDLIACLNDREEYYIKTLNSIDSKIGYNCRTSGESHIVSKETRKKISDANKGRTLSLEHRAKISASLVGIKRKPVDTRTREKMRLAKIGKKLAIGHKNNIARATMGNSRALKRVDMETVLRLYNDGMSYRGIANHLGNITHMTVAKNIRLYKGI